MNYEKYKSSKKATAIFLVILIAVITGCVQNMAAKKDELPLESKLITEISTSEDSESFNVLVKGNCELTYMSVKQLFPLSVLLYFPETSLGNIKTNISLESEIVNSITASELTEKGHKSRIKIALKKDVPYKAANEGTDLKISFTKPSKTLSSSTLSSSGPVEKSVEKKVNKPAIESKKQTLDRTSAINSKTTSKYKKPAWVNRIDFSSEETGKSTIIIGTTRPVEYRIKKVSLQLLQLELLNTRLPDYRKFPIITTRFESAVDRIIPVQTPAMKNTSMFTIELRESVPYFIEQNDNLLLIHFEASTISPRPLEDAELPAWKKVIITQTAHKGEKKEDGKIETKIDREPPAGVAAKQYKGEKIAADFYETNIKNVFRILQEVSKKNFAIDRDVAGKVTLTLYKPVPWDQVLDLVLKMNQLGKVLEGDIIRIATTKTLKKEEEFNRARLTAAKLARKEKKAIEPLITEYISVNYANATEDIKPRILAIKSERGSVSADKRTNIIIITDVAEKINRAKEVVKNLDKVTPQVIIEARIVEATTSFSRAIGTQWGIEGGIQNDDTAAGIGPQRNYDVLGGTYGYDMAMNFPVAASSSIGFNFLRIAGSPLLLNARLLAMESQGEGKIISSPKIVTLDNKKAVIKQGLRYPYNKLDESGNTVTVFEDIDLVLEVTPHMTPDQRISMIINITKNDLGIQIDGQQSFTTKEASTELLVNDGDTVVIGGIIKTTKKINEQGLPWLSKIPLLGWLFKSTNKSDEKEELLIFITPRIVQLEQRDMIR